MFDVCVSGDSFWVGKASLRSWRQLALDQLEEDEQGIKHNNIQTNGQGPHTNSKGQTFDFFFVYFQPNAEINSSADFNCLIRF